MYKASQGVCSFSKVCISALEVYVKTTGSRLATSSNTAKPLSVQYPFIIGEVGIPFDINEKAAFATGCYDKQRELMHNLIGAMEDNQVGFTLWNYNPHNTVEHGDGWNKEDFSVINGDDIMENGPILPDYRNRLHENDELYRGGRTLDVVIRPYAGKIAGQPIRSHWDCRTLRYEFEWSSKGSAEKLAENDKSGLTEVFVPSYHYAAHELSVELSDGEWSFDAEKQTLYVWHQIHQGGEIRHKLVLQIEDLRRHLLQELSLRRRSFSYSFPIKLIPPPSWEAILEGYTLNVVWIGVAGIIVAVLALLALDFWKQ